jgi:hypothetical protein
VFTCVIPHHCRINRFTMSTDYPRGGRVELISQAQAARLRGVSRQAIAKFVKLGRIRTTKVAGRIFVYRSDIVNYQVRAVGRPRSKRQ